MSAVRDHELKIANAGKTDTTFVKHSNTKTTLQATTFEEQNNKILSNDGTKLIQQTTIKPFNKKFYSGSLIKESSEKISENQSIQVQKVLKHEQELQKQLYSGANITNGWLRVNHNNKILYISPSGIGLASLKQVKDYLLNQDTCKCGLPFPLRVELFFNFNVNVPNIPLKAQIDEIKFDPNCQHRKKLSTPKTQVQQTVDGQNDDTKNVKRLKTRTKTGEYLLPSYLSTINSESIGQNSVNKKLVIENSNNVNQMKKSFMSKIHTGVMKSGGQYQNFLTVQQQNYSQIKNQQNSIEVQGMTANDNNNSMMKGTSNEEKKLPPWKRNSIQNQILPIMTATSPSDNSAIPFIQYNGQTIAIDQRNQNFTNQTQQIQIMEYKTIDNKKTIVSRQPTFKENPTAYLNQQTELLNSTISTLHSPGRVTYTTSAKINENFAEPERRNQVKQQNVFNNQIYTTDGHKIIATQYVPKEVDGKPKGNAFWVQQLQEENSNLIVKKSHTESSVTSTSSLTKYSKADQQDITSSSSAAEKANDVQTSNSNSLAESSTFSNQKRILSTSLVRKLHTQIKNSNMSADNNNSSLIAQGNEQVMVTANGQQYIVMPSYNIQSQPQTQLIQMNSNPNINQRIFQTSNPNDVTLNGQSLIFQNEQISQNNNLMLSPKNNILIAGGSIPVKTVQLGQQTIILQNNIGSQQQTASAEPQQYVQTVYQQSQQQQNKMFVNATEKKKGRKRKNLSNDAQIVIQKQHIPNNPATIHVKQESNLIQLPSGALQEGFSISGGNVILKNKIPQATSQQVFLQNGQTIIQQPIEFLRNHQIIPSSIDTSSIMTVSPDGNSFVQLQNPQPYQVILNPQMRQTVTQQQPVQKIFVGNNGQQYILQCGGGQQLNVLNPIPINSMGLVMQQEPTLIQQQQNQQQILNPIVIQSPTTAQQIINNSQIVTTNPTQILTQGMLTAQKAQIISQNNIIQQDNKLIVPRKSPQKQKSFYPRIIKVPRTGTVYATTSKNLPTYIKTTIENQSFANEFDEVNYTIKQTDEEDEEEEEETDETYYQENESEELEYSFGEDDKPDLIEELHHGTSQKIFHSNALIDGQCPIMNIDDITIEMDEINDLNDYLDAIDEEDNKNSQIGLSSLQNFTHFHPDTTTHSPKSSIDTIENAHFGEYSKSSESTENNDTVSSTLEIDSSLMGLDSNQLID